VNGATIAAVVLCCAVVTGCVRSGAARAAGRKMPDADANRGRALVASGAYGCTACHAIPGMPGPGGVVGPPLAGMARRALIAGQLPNEPEVLVAFLRQPSALVPETGMPDVRLGLDAARNIAAYLYTLEPPRGW
jgi:cytochrome c2